MKSLLTILLFFVITSFTGSEKVINQSPKTFAEIEVWSNKLEGKLNYADSCYSIQVETGYIFELKEITVKIIERNACIGWYSSDLYWGADMDSLTLRILKRPLADPLNQ